MIVDLAVQAGTPVAIVLQVPFQPLFNGLTEDRLISYTFGQYLVTQDPTWPLLLPMAKSSRAGDGRRPGSKHGGAGSSTSRVSPSPARAIAVGRNLWLTAAVNRASMPWRRW